MRVNAILVLLGFLCISTSASAQDGTKSFHCQNGLTDESCFFVEMGRCADPNPRIAIPACSRQLIVQDSRTIPGRLRRDRALRYSLRATAYAKLGDVDRALADFDRSIKSYDAFYWIHALRGSAFFALGDEKEALVSIDEAVRLAPNDGNVFNARARLLSTALDANVRNGPQAILDAQRAMALEPGMPAYVAALATAYAENGEFEKAIATQQSAIDLLDPAEPGIREVIDSYRRRLALYREGTPFRREMITCGETEDPSDADQDIIRSIFSPVVFCFRDET
nr:MAG: tetratricopeptide repeat protein [Hyphomicrobiales bacterium]